jgi:hypothetical protein
MPDRVRPELVEGRIARSGIQHENRRVSAALFASAREGLLRFRESLAGYRISRRRVPRRAVRYDDNRRDTASARARFGVTTGGVVASPCAKVPSRLSKAREDGLF